MYSYGVTLAAEDSDLPEAWADLRSRVPRTPLDWAIEVRRHMRSHRITTFAGSPSDRQHALGKLDELVQSENATGAVVLLRHPYARAWTYGDGASETLFEVFKDYASWSRRHGSAVNPLIDDMLFALGEGATEPPPAYFIPDLLIEGLRDGIGTPRKGQEVQDWLLGRWGYATDPTQRVVTFLLFAQRLKLLGPIVLAFDGLTQGEDGRLQTIEKLLVISQDCDTTFSFVLGWSGEPEAVSRLEAVTPLLASELKRSAFPLPHT